MNNKQNGSESQHIKNILEILDSLKHLIQVQTDDKRKILLLEKYIETLGTFHRAYKESTINRMNTIKKAIEVEHNAALKTADIVDELLELLQIDINTSVGGYKN